MILFCLDGSNDPNLMTKKKVLESEAERYIIIGFCDKMKN